MSFISIGEVLKEMQKEKGQIERPVVEPQSTHLPDCVRFLLAGNETLRSAVEIEPALLTVLRVAADETEYADRWFSYEACKQMLDSLVGFGARQPALRTSKHYETLIMAIDQLLPGE